MHVKEILKHVAMILAVSYLINHSATLNNLINAPGGPTLP